MKQGTTQGEAVRADRALSRPRWLRVLSWLGVVIISAFAVSTPWWGPIALSRFDYFHVRRIEFDGLRYAHAGDLIPVLHVDTTQSVWQTLEPLAARIATHAQIASASVERRLPGTLMVHVVERAPVAFAPALGVLKPADVTGRVLPIDPVKVPLDIPVIASSDTALLRVLDGLRRNAPMLYARVTEAQRVPGGELQFILGTLRIRTTSDVTVARFRDILPVEADLARNHLRVVELDLRFRDQVIARQP